jgi:multidrug efflux pump subunit AcrA (membrane-fusion protein)
MTAVAEITYRQRDDVLVVSNRAITRQGRDRFVQVVTGTGIEQRKVEVGMANDQVTEITGGDVKEGDPVVIPTTTARASIPGARQQSGFGAPGGAPAGGTFYGPAPGPAGR